MSLLTQSEFVTVLLDRDWSPETIAKESALDLRNVSDPAWQLILSSSDPVNLRLYHLLIGSLAGVEQLGKVSWLSMEWGNNIEDLAPVFKMHQLECLAVSDFPRLRTIEGIEKLNNLRELHLSGNRGSLHPTMRLESLKSIASLSSLEKLTLAVIRVEDGDITCLSSLPRIRSLTLANSFDREQFAFLASRLNKQLEQPIQASSKTMIPCGKCGGMTHLFVGRGMPILCELCDRKRFDKLGHEFDNLVSNS